MPRNQVLSLTQTTLQLSTSTISRSKGRSKKAEVLHQMVSSYHQALHQRPSIATKSNSSRYTTCWATLKSSRSSTRSRSKTSVLLRAPQDRTNLARYQVRTPTQAKKWKIWQLSEGKNLKFAHLIRSEKNYFGLLSKLWKCQVLDRDLKKHRATLCLFNKHNTHTKDDKKFN